MAWVVALALLLIFDPFDFLDNSRLTLNAFGDFLAGICAPLAFLWLFVATMVQSQELAAQRAELKLTRLEFEANREVATAQVRFIGEQTQIAKDQHGRSLLEHRAAEFDANAAELEHFVLRSGLFINVASLDGKNRDFALLRSNEEVGPQREILTHLCNVVRGLVTSLPGSKVLFRSYGSVGDDAFRRILARLKQLERMSADLPADRMPQIERLDLRTAVAALEKVFDHMGIPAVVTAPLGQ